MPFLVKIPEAEAVRRLAGGLATSLAANVTTRSATLDVNMSTRMYFLRFPWSGKATETGTLPDFRTATVGQYFLAFDWEGRAYTAPVPVPEAATADTALSVSLSDTAPIPAISSNGSNGVVSLESFFTDYFGD